MNIWRNLAKAKRNVCTHAWILSVSYNFEIGKQEHNTILISVSFTIRNIVTSTPIGDESSQDACRCLEDQLPIFIFYSYFLYCRMVFWGKSVMKKSVSLCPLSLLDKPVFKCIQLFLIILMFIYITPNIFYLSL